MGCCEQLEVAIHEFIVPSEIGGISTKELSKIPKLDFSLAIITVGFFLVTFLTLAITGYNDSISNIFLSPAYNPNNVCEALLIPTTGVYKADYYGNWETDRHSYHANASFFELEFTGTAMNNDQYQQVMTDFAAQVAKLGTYAATRNAWFTTMIQSTFQFTNPDFQMSFRSNVDSGLLMKSSAVMADWAWHSRAGFCNNTGSTGAVHATIDESRWLTMNIPLSIPVSTTSNYWAFQEFLQKSSSYQPCPAQGDIQRLASNTIRAVVATNTAEVKFDVRTINTVVALNTGFLAVSELTQTRSVFEKFAVFGFPGQFYIDEYYAPMDPIFCINSSSPIYNLTRQHQQSAPICFLVSPNQGAKSAMLFYPFVDMLQSKSGVQPSQYTSCRCPRDKYNRDCNQMNPVYNMFHRTDANPFNATLNTILFGIRMQQFKVSDPQNGDIQMMQYMSGVASAALDSFPLGSFPFPPNVPVATLYPNANESYAGTLSIQGVLKREWDKICPDHMCSSFQFVTYAGSDVGLFEAVNKYNVQLGFLSNETYSDPIYGNARVPVQACIDTISQATAMKKLASRPPSKLTHDFYACHLGTTVSVQNSIGVAIAQCWFYVGNAMIVVTFIIFTVANSCYTGLCFGYEIPCGMQRYFTPRKVNSQKLKRLLTKKEQTEVEHKSTKHRHDLMVRVILELVEVVKDLSEGHVQQAKLEMESIDKLLLVLNDLSHGSHAFSKAHLEDNEVKEAKAVDKLLNNVYKKPAVAPPSEKEKIKASRCVIT